MADWKPQRPSYVKDPYPALARLRREDPVHWDRQFEAWVVTRYEDCDFILRNPHIFSSDAHSAAQLNRSKLAAQLSGAANQGNQSVPFIRTSADEHREQRGLASPAYVPERYRAMVKNIGWKWLHGALSKPDSGAVEVMSSVANPSVIELVYSLIGPSDTERSHFESLGSDIQKWRAQSDAGPLLRQRGVRAQKNLRDLCTAALCADAPDSGAIELLRSAVDREEIAAVDASQLIFDLSIAGNNATAFLIGSVLRVLCIFPEIYQQIKDDPELAPLLVIETLRWEGPTQFVPRFATQEIQLGKRLIRPGEGVLPIVTAAGRDPERFDDPDKFSLDRNFKAQLQFGSGEHHCIGAGAASGLAEEMALALLEITDSPPEIISEEWGGTMTLRGLQSLKIQI